MTPPRPASSRRRLAFGLLVFGAATLGFLSPVASAGAPEDLTVEARPIARFAIGSSATRFGALEYRGGFSYRSANRRLSGVSSLRLRDGGGSFLTVTDTGFWFAGTIRRDPDGRPIGFDDAQIAPILDVEGYPHLRKGEADAEGLAIDHDGRAIVSFEGKHRINAFKNADAPFDSRPSPVAQPIPLRELRSNAGIEAIAVSPPSSPLRGATVVVTEQSLDPQGNLFAAILGRGAKGLFTVRREPPWSVTDGAFLLGGDLLLLERRYEGLGRIGMRIRRIAGDAIRPGAIVDGPVLIEADLGNEIDNMEGLDAWTDAAGETILSLVSDDNGSLFQRNLYLEFKLLPEGPGEPTPSN